MPTYVNLDKCDGRRALERPACAYIRPMDLMKLDTGIGKGFNQEPDLCWERYSCVKMCPNNAIEPFPDDGRPGEMNIYSPALFGADKYLGVDRLPVPGDSLGAW